MTAHQQTAGGGGTTLPAGEVAALGGTSGTPSSSNRYVTDADTRNTNQRTPSDLSVTTAKLADGSVILSKVNASLVSPAAGVAGLRALGRGATDAVGGTDPALTDARAPLDNSVTLAKLNSGLVIPRSLLGALGITNADVATGAGIAISKLAPGGEGQIPKVVGGVLTYVADTGGGAPAAGSITPAMLSPTFWGDLPAQAIDGTKLIDATVGQAALDTTNLQLPVTSIQPSPTVGDVLRTIGSVATPGYAGPSGVALRLTGPDATTTFTNNPWANCVGIWLDWSVLEPTDNAATLQWGAIETSLRYAIDNNKSVILRIAMGTSAPSWLYGTGASLGQVVRVQDYSSTAIATGFQDETFPLPWDPALSGITGRTDVRRYAQRLLPRIDSFLNTLYNGKRYRDVVVFIAVATPTTAGTEISIGDHGDPRNTAIWNAYGTVTQRQGWYGNAWKNALNDYRTLLSPAVRVGVATGSVWADGRAQSDNVIAFAGVTWPDQTTKNTIIFGPTDMQVDAATSTSYKAWSAGADRNLVNARAAGFVIWCQSAGAGNMNETYLGTPYADVASAQLYAIKKAYLDQGLHLYGEVVLETNVNIISQHPATVNETGLDTWIPGTLQPAVVAAASAGTGAATNPSTSWGTSERAILVGVGGSVPASGSAVADVAVPAPSALTLRRIRAQCTSPPTTALVVTLRRSTDGGVTYSDVPGFAVTFASGQRQPSVVDPADVAVSEGDVFNLKVATGSGSGLVVEAIGYQTQ